MRKEKIYTVIKIIAYRLHYLTPPIFGQDYEYSRSPFDAAQWTEDYKYSAIEYAEKCGGSVIRVD